MQKVGVIKTGGQVVDVLYVGGSMFMLDFPVEAGKTPAMIERSRVDELVGKNMLKLTSQDLYQKICDEIDPVTGETREFHADGTKKTEVEQVLAQLNEERSSRHDRNESVSHEPEHGRTVQPQDDSYGNEVPGVKDPSTAHSMTRRRSTKQPQQPDQDEFSQDDIFGDTFGQHAPATTSESVSNFVFDTKQETPADQGIQKVEGMGSSMGRQETEPRSLVASKSRRATMGVALGAITLIGCIASFAISFAVTRGLNMRVADIPVIGQIFADPNDRRNLPINEQVKPGETEAVTKTTTGMEVVVRDDFDPEESVRQLALADDASQDIAINFFKAIRLAYSQGNFDQLNNMIAYDYIHSQIATAYANAEQQRTGLTEDAKNQMIAQYVGILNQREGTHIANHDMDASIYCGRVREVRVDDSDPLRLYVVMESLGGDHQRACFILMGDGSGAYAVIGMVNPEGYVNMIMKGTI